VSPAQKKEPRTGWNGSLPVRDWLYTEPWEFEFFQAIRLLEALSPSRRPPGEGSGPDDEVVHLTSRIALDFPASELQELLPADATQPPTLVTNLMALGGPSGPLPEPDTEMVLERLWDKDTAVRDFLDIFHHRLLSLLVRVRKAHDPAFTTVRPEEGAVAKHLYAIFGMGHASLRNRLRADDRALLFYSGILSQHPRSAAGLERLLSDYFQVGARVSQFGGSWCQLDPDQWTTLGRSGQNRSLGTQAMLGTRAWNQAGSFQVNLGPLNIVEFVEFLPVGSAYEPLCELTRYYAGETLAFSFRLTLKAADVPGTRLKRDSWLGWTTWLNTKGAAGDDSQVRLGSGWNASAARGKV